MKINMNTENKITVIAAVICLILMIIAVIKGKQAKNELEKDKIIYIEPDDVKRLDSINIQIGIMNNDIMRIKTRCENEKNAAINDSDSNTIYTFKRLVSGK